MARFVSWRSAFLAAVSAGLATHCTQADDDAATPGGAAGSSAGSRAIGQGGASGRANSAGLAGTDDGATAGGGADSGGIGHGGAAGSANSPAGGAGSDQGGAAGTANTPAGGAGSDQGGAVGDPFSCTPVKSSRGYVECRGGWMHRARVEACPSSLPRAESGAAGGGPLDQVTCNEDADCTDHPYGFCESYYGANFAVRECTYGCVVDADCRANEICVCGSPVGRCAPSNCVDDGDCGKGHLCAASPPFGDVCSGVVAYEFACQTDEDVCIAGDDCPTVERPNCFAYGRVYGTDDPVSTAGRVCGLPFACGRPFLVEGAARLASLDVGGGWVRRQQPSTRLLTADERTALFEHWTAQALMEHASVAAFARFALELLALGAPAELLSQTQAALGDEIEHATICFGLASAYAGSDVQPGPLDLRGVLPVPKLANVVETAILEACVGETVAAVEAQIALDHATDPEVRRALSRIANDEARHAALGWRFVSWALAGAAADVRKRAIDTLERAIRDVQRRAASAAPARPPAAVEEHGMLCPALRAHAARVALNELLLPCFWALGQGLADCDETTPTRGAQAEHQIGSNGAQSSPFERSPV
jgi:hypothetical protein